MIQRILITGLLCTVAGCAQHDSGRPFDESKADHIRIGTTTKSEVRQMLGPPHTSGLTPMVAFAPGMQTVPMAAMPGVVDPMASQKNTEYWTYQYSKHGASVTSPFSAGGSGKGASLQITFTNDIVSECIHTSTVSTNNVLIVPYFTSGRNEGTTHQRRCGEKSAAAMSG